MATGHIKALFFIWEVWTLLSLKLLVDKAAVQLRGALITSGWHGQKLSTLNSSQQLKKLEDRKKLQNCLSKSEIENICYSLMGLSNLITSSHCKCSQDPNPLAHGRLPKASEVGNPFRGESELSSDLELAMNLRRYVISLALPKDFWPGHLLTMETYD